MGFTFLFLERETNKHVNHILPEPLPQTLGATSSLTGRANSRAFGVQRVEQ
jgi:hypothetical protein